VKQADDTQILGVQAFSDSVDRLIVFKAPLSVVGTPASNWAYIVVVGSQDYSAFREFFVAPQEWKFGGGDDSAYDPNVVDMLVPEGINQDDILDAYSVADQSYCVLPAVGPGIGFEADTTNPTITITAPENNSVFSLSGETYDLTVEWDVIDPDQGTNAGIDRVEIYVDGVFTKEVLSNETSAVLELEKGTHTIRLNAYDLTGNFASASITVEIKDTAAIPGFDLFFAIAMIAIVTISTKIRRKK
jgi:hypothetical protein